jgi:hypothetical protein
MKMEQTECSETSAYKTQTPGNYPEQSIQRSEHGGSLKSRIYWYLFTDFSGQPVGPISVFDCLTREEETDWSSRNVGKRLQTYAV